MVHYFPCETQPALITSGVLWLRQVLGTVKPWKTENKKFATKMHVGDI